MPLMGTLRATWHLFVVSLLRLVRSRQTAVSLLLLAFAALAVIAWSIRRERTPAQFTEEIFLTLYTSLLVPIFCLCYGTVGVASDREEQTLVYLLVSPLPRPFVYLAKTAAAFVPSLAWTLGSLALLCWLGGAAGRKVWPVVWPASLFASLAFVSLFSVFSVLFRRATVLALTYALFLEALVGNLPGIAKRMAISFYMRCLVFDSAEQFQLSLRGLFQPEVFLPIPGSTAQNVLLIASASLLLFGLVVFCLREYASA